MNTDSDDKIVSCLFASDVEVFVQTLLIFYNLNLALLILAREIHSERATQENRSLEFGVTGIIVDVQNLTHVNTQGECGD